MAEYTALAPLFTDIANAIRSKTGETGAITANNFPEKIIGLNTGISGVAVEIATSYGGYELACSCKQGDYGGVVLIDNTAYQNVISTGWHSPLGSDVLRPTQRDPLPSAGITFFNKYIKAYAVSRNYTFAPARLRYLVIYWTSL